jgi:hypothetical protein
MPRKRTVQPEDSLTEPSAKPGTYVARRAKAALRADESRRLSKEETAEAMGYTEKHIETLDAIASGLPVRNAREVIAALRLKADFLMPKPSTSIDHRVAVLVVKDPYEEDGLGALPVAVVAAQVVALPEPDGQALADAGDDDGEGEA